MSRPYCQPRTFTGTAPSFEDRGRDPDPDFDIDADGDFYWFSCVVGKSPDPTVGMATIGWASGALSWFATSADPGLLAETVRLLDNGGEPT